MRHNQRIVICLLVALLAETAFGFGRHMLFNDRQHCPPDDPGGQVDFVFNNGDDIYGALHSNDYIRIYRDSGYPHFYGLVTTSKEDVIWVDGTNPAYNIFHEGLLVNHPDSSGHPFPPTYAIQEVYANTGLVIMAANVYVDSVGSFEEIATTMRLREDMLQIEQWFCDLFYSTGDTVYFEEYYESGSYLPLPPPEQGVVTIHGKLFLEGYLTGQLTIISSDTIWLIDDVYYDDIAFDGVDWIGDPPESEMGMPPLGSLNRLGIISEKNVIIAFTPQNGGYHSGEELPGCDAVQGIPDRENIVINAAVMALDNVFEVDFWHNSCTIGDDNPYGLPESDPCNTDDNDHRGRIYFWGSITQKYRGFTYRSSPGPYGSRQIGYAKRYNYDENLSVSFPPFFPVLRDTMEVPHEYPTIQSAIDNVNPSGDIILVSPGVYQENLLIDSLQLTLTSHYQLDGGVGCIEETVIDGGGTDAVIRIVNGQSSVSRISGFTITNGGGYQPDTSTVTLGGGIHCVNNSLILEDLLIYGNQADVGGGIFFTSSSGADLTLQRLTITGNSAEVGGALFCFENVTAVLDGSILWDNGPVEIYGDISNEITASCCDIQGGWPGESIIDADPIFCNPWGDHYRLQPDSPCRTDNCGVLGYSDAQCDPELVDDFVVQPPAITLSQNYPNPFNPSTTIEFSLPYLQEINLTVYNLLGQEVAVLAEGSYAAGVHEVVFNTNTGAIDRSYISSGIYVYRLATDDNVISRKMVFLK